MAIDQQKIDMARIREALISKRNRQRAVAMFPLRVAQLASDLKRLCDRVDSSESGFREIERAKDFLEERIRACYRETFGTELGE